jgi:Flp pilus assembly pilin Flp
LKPLLGRRADDERVAPTQPSADAYGDLFDDPPTWRSASNRRLANEEEKVIFKTYRMLMGPLGRAREDDGQALVEYSLLLSLIAIVCFVAVETFGLRVSDLFSHIISVYPN